MSARKVVFDQPGLPLSEPAVRPRPGPQGHRCHCGAWASYGIREPGIAGLRQPVRVWTCSIHRPETV